MQSANDVLIDLLKSKLVNESTVYTVTSPVKVTMKYAEKVYHRGKPSNYSVKPLDGNEEFFLANIRAGSRKPFIFEFKPLDTRPYQHVEMDERTAMTLFPDFGKQMADAIGMGDVSWNYARSKFLTKTLKENEEARKAAEINKYDHNASWGTF